MGGAGAAAAAAAARLYFRLGRRCSFRARQPVFPPPCECRSGGDDGGGTSSALFTNSDTRRSFLLISSTSHLVFFLLVFFLCACFCISLPNASLRTQLDIFASMPDVLGISQDALCSDVKTAENETCSAAAREHQLDLLVVSDGDADRTSDDPQFHSLTQIMFSTQLC